VVPFPFDLKAVGVGLDSDVVAAILLEVISL
jgi:hypothetical protein